MYLPAENFVINITTRRQLYQTFFSSVCIARVRAVRSDEKKAINHVAHYPVRLFNIFIRDAYIEKYGPIHTRTYIHRRRRTRNDISFCTLLLIFLFYFFFFVILFN